MKSHAPEQRRPWVLWPIRRGSVEATGKCTCGKWLMDDGHCPIEFVQARVAEHGRRAH